MRFFQKNSFLPHVSLLVGLTALAQLAGVTAGRFLSANPGVSFLGFSLEKPLQNCHLIFGWNFGLPPLFANTVMAGVFCAGLFYYTLFLIFLPQRLFWLKAGVSFVFAGFAGNGISKFAGACPVDFIKWAPSSSFSLWFNLSDIFQTCGWALVFAQLFLLRKSLYRANERRKRLLVRPTPQLQFVGYCVLAFVCLSAFFLLINYQFLLFADLSSFPNIRYIGLSFLKFSLLILFFLCFVVAVFFFYLSNKIYGPLFSFEKYIKALIRGGKPKKFKLRKNDQLRHLEDLAGDIKKAWDKQANRHKQPSKKKRNLGRKNYEKPRI